MKCSIAQHFGAIIVNFDDMKKGLLILIIFLGKSAISQDTLSFSARYDKPYSVLLAGKDTNWFHYYPNGQLESTIGFTNIPNKTVKHTRYYESGKIMWIQEISNGKKNGVAIYNNEKGTKVASFNYHNDSISDTLFLNSKQSLLFGKITYASKIYGGMQNEDGSSNISQHEGPQVFSSFYTVKMDKSIALQRKYKNFRTDFNGDFFVIIEKGSFGFFPERHDIKLVNPSIGTEAQYQGGSMQGGWNLVEPYNVSQNGFNFLHLHHSSVGYAP